MSKTRYIGEVGADDFDNEVEYEDIEFGEQSDLEDLAAEHAEVQSKYDELHAIVQGREDDLQQFTSDYINLLIGEGFDAGVLDSEILSTVIDYVEEILAEVGYVIDRPIITEGPDGEPYLLHSTYSNEVKED